MYSFVCITASAMRGPLSADRVVTERCPPLILASFRVGLFPVVGLDGVVELYLASVPEPGCERLLEDGAAIHVSCESVDLLKKITMDSD